ncbi:FMRFamide receptor-like [Gigantopelta aegis]|uniref:FMRFamide receptor-like n=1 Tax=Gigantopelta aegis TaxID=1735272 RepID=UPI001B88E43B|nr:FMRFamide receptor-like [Gigantopelta aegis]
MTSEDYVEHDESPSTTNSCCHDDISNNTTPKTKSKMSLLDMGSIPREMYEDFRGVYKYLQFVVISLAILNNSFNIVVFTQTRMRSATSKILTFLSFSELAVAIVELIVNSYATALEGQTYMSKLYWHLFKWGRLYVTMVFQRSSICFNLIVATERYIAVRFPLKAHQILRRRSPVVFCGAVLVVIFGIHIFSPLKLKVATVTRRHVTLYVFGNSLLYDHNQAVFEGLALATKIMFVYIPLFGCLLMNVLMVLALRQHRIQRKAMHLNRDVQQQSDRREILTTTTILISSLLFVLLALPITVSSIVQITHHDYGLFKREHYLFQFIVSFGGMLSLVGLSMDFFVYMIFNREFRRTFTNLMRFFFRQISSCCGQIPASDGPETGHYTASEGTNMSVVTMQDMVINEKISDEPAASSM